MPPVKVKSVNAVQFTCQKKVSLFGNAFILIVMELVLENAKFIFVTLLIHLRQMLCSSEAGCVQFIIFHFYSV